jgi:c-di-GMP-binding flagellar brake protein YcgR
MLVDISATGARFAVRARLTPGIPVELHFTVGERQIVTTAHIVHLAEGNGSRHHGMRFADLEPEDRAAIARFVFASLAAQEQTLH